MSNKLKEVILKLDKALNLIKTQEKEIERLNALLLKTIVNKKVAPQKESNK